ncbi:MAG TPA: TIGR04086 family membrane protein [Chloroflexia bacterium]|nr:TIGR04086 family membrane protein [Chloroflexia bacterium]
MNVKAHLSQIRWDIILKAAVLVYIGTFILGIALSFPLLAFLSWVSLSSDSALQITSLVSVLLVVVVTGYGAWRVARRVVRAALLHGVLVGLVVALLSCLLDVLFSKAITLVGVLLYVLMVVAGLLGGVLGGRRRQKLWTSSPMPLSPKQKRRLATMNKYDFDYLREKVWTEDLTRDEVALVAAELQEPTTDTNPVTLLSIMCYSQAKQYTPLVERYLNGPDDWLASEALWVLCSCWQLSPRYINKMLAFMGGAPKDEYRDRKRIAISCAGIHLERYPAPKLLRQLINILEDENEDESARVSAYEALYVIAGGDRWKYPKTPANFDPSTDADPVVVKLAKERLGREEEQEGQD